MQPDRAERIAELVEHAFELEGAERAAFLAQACGDDVELRAEVEALLSRRGVAAERLMSQPAVEFGAELLREDVACGELIAGEMLGDYRIISLLGEGGMGEVYLADDTHFGRQVAIKLIKQGFGTKEFVRHFRQEERILAALNHPNIARLYGGAVTPGWPSLFRDGIRGGNSARKLRRRAFVRRARASRSFSQSLSRQFPTRTKISSSIAISSRPISASPRKANRSFWISASRACSIPKRRRQTTKPS